MKFMKISVVLSVFSAVLCAEVYADDVESLPTIKMMADAELRDEVLTTIPPLQEDESTRRVLQHYMIKKEQNIQNYEIVNQANIVNVQPTTAMPDMSHLTPMQQQYVLSVAAGLQSNDPSSGIFRMLEPLGIDREKALNHIQHGGGAIPMTFDEQRLNQLLGDGWRGRLK